MKFTKSILSLTFAGFILATTQCFASLNDAKQLNDFDNSLFQSIGNMRPMIDAINLVDEKEWAFILIGSLLDMHEEFHDLIDYEILKNEMNNVNDKAAVNKRIQKRVGILNATCTSDVEHINHGMVMLNNAALLSEAQQARASIIQACDAIRYWK
jgi:hypothetical protein